MIAWQQANLDTIIPGTPSDPYDMSHILWSISYRLYGLPNGLIVSGF